jgi:hypothetical protein
MLYWLTDSIVPSMRLYKEFVQAANSRAYFMPFTKPVGLSLFPHEILPPPERYVRRHYTDIVTFREHGQGGHFAALEEPDALARDIVEFVDVLRRRIHK